MEKPTAPVLNEEDNINYKKINNIIHERRQFHFDINCTIKNCKSMSEGFHMIKKISCLMIIELIYRWPISDRTAHALMSQMYTQLSSTKFVAFSSPRKTFQLTGTFKVYSNLPLFPSHCAYFDNKIMRQFYLQGQGLPIEINYQLKGTIKFLPSHLVSFFEERDFKSIESYDPDKVKKTCSRLLKGILDSPIFDFPLLLKNVDIGFSISLDSSSKSDVLASWFKESSSQPSSGFLKSEKLQKETTLYKKGKKVNSS